MKRMHMLCAIVLVFSILMGGCANLTSQAPSDDFVTLRVQIFDRGDVPAGAGTITDNAMTKWVQENFGDKNNIKLEYVPIPRVQEGQQLNVLMASGDAPDIIYTYNKNLVYDYIKQGGLTDLSEVIDEHGETLKKFLGEDILNKGVFDGKQYTIPAKRIMRPCMSQMIRQDWLDKLNLPVPTTTEEFYNTMKAFKEQDPGELGEDCIPFGVTAQYPYIWDLVRSFIRTDEMTEEDFYCMPEVIRPGYKEGVRFLNKMYNEGLMSKDFALDKDNTQRMEDIANGRVGFFVDDFGRALQNDGVYGMLQNNISDAVLTPADTFTDNQGNHPKYIYAVSAADIMIPKSSKRAVEAIKYLNWISDEKNLFIIQNGFEGKNYTKDDAGFPVKIDSDESNKTHWYNLGVDLGIVVNGKYMDNTEKSIEFNSVATGKNKELYIKAHDLAVLDGWTDYSLNQPIDAQIKYGAILSEKLTAILVKSIMASPSSFDKVYDSLVDEYMKIGGDKVYEESKLIYKNSFSGK